jgi:hypothetical protein
MSTYPSKITAILIGNEWIEVKSGTFSVGVFEFKEGDLAVYRAGIGFVATASDGSVISGPISSLLAVKTGGTTTVRKGRPPTKNI